MANEKHIELLNLGVVVWNAMRKSDSWFCPDLSGADLRGFELNSIDLHGADLTNTDLRQANLIGANLAGAKLTNTLLRGANLEGADLTGTTGLLSNQLGDTMLRRAQMPGDKFEFPALAKADEISKSAGALFISMLAGCAYSVLTIGTTTDSQLLTNSANSKLPIIQTEIPIVGFYLVAPLLLLGIYVNFHLYMQRLWELLATLPAVFPDGIALHRKTQSWLVNDLVCKYFMHLKPDQPALFLLQEKLSEVLARSFVVIVFLWLWYRFLARHDWLGTGLHVALIGAIFWASISFAGLTKNTLLDIESEEKSPDKSIAKKLFNLRGGSPLLTIPIFSALSTLLIYFVISADFVEADVSTKPDKWEGLREQVKFVKGARLQNCDLRYVRGRRAFLVKADLRGANLQNADLEDADLRGADLSNADLRGAILRRTDLQDGHLKYANFERAFMGDSRLERANLSSAKLQSAYLGGANLQYANLYNVNLQNATLVGADLKKANLMDANLEKAVLQGATLDSANLDSANLDGANLQDANLNNAHLVRAKLHANFLRASLQGAHLQDAIADGVDLRYANMKKSHLNRAHFQKAQMQSADLQGADLRDANLNGADLQNSHLNGAHLNNAHLNETNLVGADLRRANLQGAVLHGADLSAAELRNSYLKDASFWGADFDHAHLEGAQFQDAVFVNADFEGAFITGANLKGSDLRFVKKLTWQQVHSAIIDAKTKLPKYLKH